MDQAVATPARADAPQPDVIRTMALAARVAARVLARSTTETRNKALSAAAAALRAAEPELLAANARDVAAFSGAASFRDRLTLNHERVEAMAQGLEQIAALPDPVGHVMAQWDRPNGLRIRRVATPVGVIGMIYESRPNVGADAAALCIKSGNAVILRGGSDSLNSARVIHAAMQAGLAAAGLPVECVQIPPDADRAHVAAMLGAAGLIDLIIPRGGKSLVERVCAEARVPVLAHAEGLCHTYVHAAADLEMARRIVLNAKLRRPGICGATETLLVDQAIAPKILPGLIEDLATRGCTFRADERARAIIPDLPAATDADFATEWLDAVLSVAVVDGVEDALAHIARYGSAHTEAIVTEDAQAATTFLNGTDSAVVMWNASTQFCDGGEFGFGAEIGIATGRFHARGPVGLEQLTTFRYEVIGTGQVRP
ncbi:glutamate-5-semialdehyde dehydrogenase [Komagataeibacter sp. AV436]|uniref:Gamma-glutamyl phosphate reductase n=1 Tax=Komagataeibacter melomenusus TaxID=2766578 RepID=A0ABX2ADG7_9PROT|nr:glutamate-5-semialdehyde dehydrogenase [Komagataeibacter melomenusus]MBV1830734.1 glutamate-5-semialdehyde dehydrogenase [Komagataeibacter melomenusus]NPC66342.1 glutamate-5-semialdehyde dehydrogenase [Komagataeibacter melomenusus]